ncbi:uncharacterized protein [Dysidea avara]|uniref:uncharacterized protein n=1 Tax=Dysidea avara TaxID=196820 RepID=UPI003317C5DE
MDASESDMSGLRRLSDLCSKQSDEALKSHASHATKLADTMADFLGRVANAEEQHAQHLNNILKNYRRKTMDLKREKHFYTTSSFSAWEQLLDELEAEAKLCTELSSKLSETTSQPLQETAIKKKSVLKKTFTARDDLNAKIDKADIAVNKAQKEYSDQWVKFNQQDKDSVKDSRVLHCYNAHNDYVITLKAYNEVCSSVVETHHPYLLDDMQGIHNDLTRRMASAMKQYITLVSEKLIGSQNRLTAFLDTIESVDGANDISGFVIAQKTGTPSPPPSRKFHHPEPSASAGFENELKVTNITQTVLLNTQEVFQAEAQQLVESIAKCEKDLKSLKTLYESYINNPNYGDARSIEEELMETKNRLRLLQIDQSAVNSKLELFGGTVSYSRAPWATIRRTNVGALEKGRQHEFALFTYRIPTFCDYCRELLIGLHKQGNRCKICKKNIHQKCMQYMPDCTGQPVRKESSTRAKLAKRFSVLSTTSIGEYDANEAPPTHTAADYESLDSVAVARAGNMYRQRAHTVDEYLCPREVSPELNDMPPMPPMRTTSTSKGIRKLPEVPRKPTSYRSSPILSRYNDMPPPTESPPPLPKSPSSAVSSCVALFSYQASSSGDLDLLPGDIIEVTSSSGKEWWEGILKGVNGYFPVTYVQPLQAGDKVMKVLYEFNGSKHDEMSLVVDQIVVLKEDLGDGWMRGMAGNSSGLFPSTYVEELL